VGLVAAGKVLLDANIFVRYLINDDPVKAAKCEALLKSARSSKEPFFVSDLCIAEVVWVLHSFYKVERKRIALFVHGLLNIEGLVFTDAAVLVDAVLRYSNTSVDFIDCYHAAHAA
jgi:predicted nucleic-acid-binding protein